jgi:hypothetical protein
MNTVNPTTTPASTGNPAESKQILLKDIGAKWSKVSEQELGALKNKDDLVTQGRRQGQHRQGAGAARRRRRDEGPPDLIWMLLRGRLSSASSFAAACLS